MVLSVKSAALRFLKIRPQSIAELREKLKLKGFSMTDIETAVLELTASGLLDDRAFTKSWINYRLARPFGFRRIIQELKSKGIDPLTIEQAVAEIKDSYNADKTALELARRRWQRLPAIDPLKKKKRVLDFLLRRGFEADVAIRVIKKL
ncbi:MAG: regulatory protein RecX [Candidatus Omnitrophica bacterium]|nr:regulatory protein RecX [Candidatus Omnitrophota bacterium]